MSCLCFSPTKSKEVIFEGTQTTPAPVNEKRNSGEFIIDMKEMEKELKKKKLEKSEKPSPVKFLHKFDEILSQIDKPRKRESKGSASPISPERSPKFDPIQQRKHMAEQSKERTILENKKMATATSPPRQQQREEKRSEKSVPRDGGNKVRKESSSSSKSPPYSHSPVKLEPKVNRPNKTPDRSHAAGSPSTSTKPSTHVLPKQNKIESEEPPKIVYEKMAHEPEDNSTKVADVAPVCSVESTVGDSDEFFGFPAKESMYETVLDYEKVQQILKVKMSSRTLHLVDCEKSFFELFKQTGFSVVDVTDAKPGKNEMCPKKGRSSVAMPQSKEPKKNATTTKNGVRTSTPSQSQHKLFIENNQFAGTQDAKQMSKKRRASGTVQGSATKIVRLADSKLCGDEQTSPTPSEQSKENQISHQIKKHNRTADNTCTSNGNFRFGRMQIYYSIDEPMNFVFFLYPQTELDHQPTAERSETSKPNQRYNSDDLYKPRPVWRSRRRGIENGEI